MGIQQGLCTGFKLRACHLESGLDISLGREALGVEAFSLDASPNQ